MGSGDLATKAREAKAELVMSRQDLEGMAGDKKEVKKLANAYDYFIAEAPLMPVVGKTLGQSLGPRGKMPTPITPGSSIGELIDKHRKMIRIRVRDNPLVQCKVGPEDMPIDQIADNIEAVISRLEGKLERGNKNISSVFLKYTMSNPVKLTL